MVVNWDRCIVAHLCKSIHQLRKLRNCFFSELLLRGNQLSTVFVQFHDFGWFSKIFGSFQCTSVYTSILFEQLNEIFSLPRSFFSLSLSSSLFSIHNQNIDTLLATWRVCRSLNDYAKHYNWVMLFCLFKHPIKVKFSNFLLILLFFSRFFVSHHYSISQTELVDLS